ncbi:hypothetical protein [Flavobacterium sp.]|uniref:hypothetical protein n=1 Tax=Flavobacterium sp. TaxID=239 RepID=UPI0039E6D3A6
MKINPKHGIDKLLFGMKLADVSAVYGKPDKEYKDEDDNLIALYNEQKFRLTFYQEEDLKLGYIIASDPGLELTGIKMMGRKALDVQNELRDKGFQKWTKEGYDTYENWFNEDHWTVLQTEFDVVVKFEMGAIINDKDEFDWKFKG